MNRLVVSVLLFLALTPGGAFSETWQKKVSFEVPASWKLPDSKATDTVVAKVYFIRKDVIGSETHFSNALLQYYPIPTSITMAHADSIVASHTKGAAVILSAQDGPDWKTYLLVNRERNQQYNVLYRIGIIEAVCLELMLVFPILADKTETSLSLLTLNPAFFKGQNMAGVYCHRSTVKEMVDAFNSACEKLRIAGRGQYNANVTIIDPPANVKVYRYKGQDNDAK